MSQTDIDCRGAYAFEGLLDAPPGMCPFYKLRSSRWESVSAHIRYTLHHNITNTCNKFQRLSIDRSKLLKAWAGKHVLMIGDSLTRYQYLNLAYFLATGDWGVPNHTPLRRNENERDFESWAEFYKLTNARMQGKEICDCYRPPYHYTADQVREGRYYFDPEMGVRLTLISQFGEYPLTLHTPIFLNMTGVQSGCLPGACDDVSDLSRVGVHKMTGAELWVRLVCEPLRISCFL